MLFGTVIRMKNNDSFITQAMLASYLSVEEKDYLTLIKPFLLNCLPVELGIKIEIEDIQESLNKEYNLDILCNVVEKLLQKCCKQKNGAYVKKENGSYYLNKVFDSTKFEENKQKIKKSLNDVITELQKYLTEEKKLSGITQDVVNKNLSIFFDTYNYAIYENTERANGITIGDSSTKSNYYIAQFILREYNKNSVLFDYIMEIIKGTLVAKSIYYFMYEDNNTSKNQIAGTSFYLDTRLLIEALGLNSLQEQRAMKELMKIIIDNGGYLKTFNYYIEELQGIIYKYIKDPESRLSLSLNKFSIEKYSTIDIKAYLDTLETRISDIGIICEEKPDYEENLNSQQWHIDYTELRNELSNNIDYRGGVKDYFPDSLIHDADSIEAIAFLRGKTKKCSIMDCKSIFVTNNRDIVNVVHNLYYKDRFKKGEISFVITDIDLTAMLWLSTFGNQSELPKLKLLENVYAACAPSNAVMKAFLTRIKTMEENSKISKETALLLRTQYSMVDDLVEITNNSSENINDKTVMEMQSRLVNRERKNITIEVQKSLELEIEKTKNEKDLVERERDEIEEKRSELINLQRRINKDKIDNEHIEKRLDNQRNRNELDKAKINRSLEHIEKIKKYQMKKSKNIAKIVSSIFRIISIIFLTTVAFLIVIIFAIETYKISSLCIDNLVIPYIIVGIISVISLMLTIYSLKKVAFRLSEKIAIKIYDNIYSYYINKNKELFED